MNTFHFFGPLVSNSVSSLVLKSRQQLNNVHTDRRLGNVFREQIRQHKHLLTGPVTLTILTIAHLIIIFMSKCMQSANDSWLFLIGYFISFIPSILTFVQICQTVSQCHSTNSTSHILKKQSGVSSATSLFYYRLILLYSRIVEYNS